MAERPLWSYEGCTVSFDRPLKNGLGELAGGTPLIVMSTGRKGLDMLTATPCKVCKVRWRVRVGRWDLCGMTVLQEPTTTTVSPRSRRPWIP